MLIHLAEDPDELVAVLREIGFLRPGVQADGTRLRALFERSGAAVRSETFHFDGAFLRDALQGMTASLPVGLSLAFPPEYVQAQRALGVGIGVLCQLNAEVPFQGEALRWLGDAAGAPG